MLEITHDDMIEHKLMMDDDTNWDMALCKNGSML